MESGSHTESINIYKYHVCVFRFESVMSQRSVLILLYTDDALVYMGEVNHF